MIPGLLALRLITDVGRWHPQGMSNWSGSIVPSPVERLKFMGCVGERKKARGFGRRRQDASEEVNKQSLLATTMTTVQHTNTDFLTAIHNANLETLIASGNMQLLLALQELISAVVTTISHFGINFTLLTTSTVPQVHRNK